MSYHEALADGVRTTRTRRGLAEIYFPRCRFCGEEVRSLNYIRSYHYCCIQCRKKKKILLRTGLFM
jgi:hypothetical protein